MKTCIEWSIEDRAQLARDTGAADLTPPKTPPVQVCPVCKFKHYATICHICKTPVLA